ncbi:acetyl-CoA carboxylase biotin carboxylase subunit [Pantoea cypripedii]|uniref:biotin carboxylase n=1 Tax=Pantoea cypripedii TaxID=55209 RepID=A0A6B9GF43_PANCY|nr:acetyl-CoA carboxylase biotin carboxylase subunit [Pantoea cypripedii]QGY32947.1 acetyl-CoA carboxylase biotin carboxylase subunit [Pantoea cypripedii]
MITIKKLFIANRGEIALRVIRAAHELGIETVLGCSEADKDSLPARMAGAIEVIGPAAAKKSYLNIEAVIAAARASGADAVHPGYGFLSENSEFAAAVNNAGMVFVGPSAETIALMGNKASARLCAERAGVPTVPGSKGVVRDIEDALREARVIGYPIMLKAAAGGGGRGIRVAHNEAELEKEYAVASREALGAFGDGDIYLERYITRARHVEVQILGDGQHAVHLFDRDCSLQRQRQKLVEEAPAPVLPETTRGLMGEASVRLAESVGYSGAGTLEFLYSPDSDEFFFIEMNTRIQVEHPVTEMVTGIDLVRETLHIASGHPLRFTQDAIVLRGAAIECRINAEDPFVNFKPSPGTVKELTLPSGPGVRVDSMLYAGYAIPFYYDSLLAKIIVWDEDRASAIKRMMRALKEMKIEGVTTTIPLHLAILEDSGVLRNDIHNAYLEESLLPDFVDKAGNLQ